MKRYITILNAEDGEVLASIDQETGKTFFRGDIKIQDDDYEDIFVRQNGKVYWVCNDH